MRTLAAAALLAALSVALPARAADPVLKPSRVTAQQHRAPLHHVLVDVLLVRPIGLPMTAILGGGFWLLGAPVFAVTGDMEWWTDTCLEEPLRQHIQRPLGEL